MVAIDVVVAVAVAVAATAAIVLLAAVIIRLVPPVAAVLVTAVVLAKAVLAVEDGEFPLQCQWQKKQIQQKYLVHVTWRVLFAQYAVGASTQRGLRVPLLRASPVQLRQSGCVHQW